MEYINDLRAITTVFLFFVFLGIVWWAYGRGRRQYFDEAAAIPFLEDDEPGAAKPVVRVEKRMQS